MKEYEISINDNVLGKVKVYKDNITNDIKKSLIESNSGLSFDNSAECLQTYEIVVRVDNVDELYDIVSKYIYNSDKIFKQIEEIKKYNDIKFIKKDTDLKIVVPECYLTNLNISKENIDYNSLVNSKVYFIKNTTKDINLIENLNSIIEEYNNYIKSNEYEFYEMEEKNKVISKYLYELDKLIENIENSTKYKYAVDYVIPIRISNN